MTPVKSNVDVEEELKAIIETAVDSIIVIDEDGNILSVNPATCRTFDYGMEDLISSNITMLMPKEHKMNHASYIKNYMVSGVPKVIGKGRHTSAVKRDGTVFPIDLAVSEIIISGMYVIRL
jgi:PAS domain S-box-containing protein